MKPITQETLEEIEEEEPTLICCGDCGSLAFILSTDGFIHCLECQATVLASKWYSETAITDTIH